MRRRIQEGVEKEDIHICGDACSLSGAACDFDVLEALTTAGYNRTFFDSKGIYELGVIGDMQPQEPF